MEMLTDPMLRQWVPEWLVEQYERANPFYREVLTSLQAENMGRNRGLLKRTKREMIRRHQRYLRKAAQRKASGKGASSSSEGERTGGESGDSGGDVLETAFGRRAPERGWSGAPGGGSCNWR